MNVSTFEKENGKKQVNLSISRKIKLKKNNEFVYFCKIIIN